MSECKPRMTSGCNETLTPGTSIPAECPTWSACLPFGGRIFSEGGCVNYEPGTPPPDGIYTKVIVENGCITELHLADIPIYTATPCASIPAPCDGEGTGLPDPSPTIGNLFTYDASGRPLVRLTVQNGSGISVTGDGTTTSPLVITNTQVQISQIPIQGSQVIQVTGGTSVADPWRIAHAQALGGVQGLYTFDEFGHLIGFNPSSTQMFVTGIVEGDGIRVDMNPNTGIATVALADPIEVVTGIRRIGGWDVEFHRNRILRINQVITLAADTYKLGNYDVGINEFGSITSLTYVAPPSEDPTLMRAAASKRFMAANEDERTMTINLEKAGSLRVMYQAANVPADILLFINNVNITGFREATRFNAIAPALYAAGLHSITIQSATTFSGEGYLDAFVTVVS